MENQHKQFLLQAIAKAQQSIEEGGFPAGAIVVKDGEIIGSGLSLGNKLSDPTSHGEMASIRDACRNLNGSDLSKTTLYASMQPCLMCFAASAWASIPEIVFACSKEKVSDEYYAGNYDIDTINTKLLHPIGLVHLPELEDASLSIVRKWEQSNLF